MPSSHRWPLSQNANKSQGTCSICFQTHQLHLRNNTVHTHGPRLTPCPGSNLPPLGSSSHLATRSSTSAVGSNSSHGASSANCNDGPICSQVTSSTSRAHSVSNSALSIGAMGSGVTTQISHPSSSMPIVKHIPKSARPACCLALAEILKQIVRNSSDILAWDKLFHFAPTFLWSPPKTGTCNNLCTIIKNRISNPGTSLPPRHVLSSQRASRKTGSDQALSVAVSSKIEDGNIKAALRILLSEDKPADFSEAAFSAIADKHPKVSSNMSSIPDPSSFASLLISESEVLKAIRSFPAGSSGGPDGFRPQHLADLVRCNSNGPALLSALTGFVNLILNGDCPLSVRPTFFGGRLLAIEKKFGGFRPIAVGYTLRRLVSKCANTYAQSKLSDYFQPSQLGVGVSGGCEAAVHATRRFVENFNPNDVLVKLDFSNAFNTLHRDAMLQSVSNELPEVYRFCHSAYSRETILQFGNKSVISAEGVQQGDPIGPLLFCLTLHPILNSLSSPLKIGYLDDLTLGGSRSSVNKDVLTVMNSGSSIGLFLNEAKCEIISHAPESSNLHINKFVHVFPPDAVLLGAPLLEGPALDQSLSTHMASLSTGQKRLNLITSHDALLLLKSSLSAPKLLHTLRAAPCSGHALLSSIDRTLRDCVSQVVNTSLNDEQWLQASLPVKSGGLGVRLSSHLAPSAFLAASSATDELQSEILSGLNLPKSVSQDSALANWTVLSSAASCPIGPAACKQREWDKPIVDAEFGRLLTEQVDDRTRARLLAVTAPHSGDWINALPISSCGLRLDDESIRISVGLRLGTDLCMSHQCVCGSAVDASGIHGLSCKKNTARINRHSVINDIIHRSLIRASVPAVKEPPGLLRSDGKRPDGVTQIPWHSGKCLAWDVTVTDTLATSYANLSAISAGNAAERAASNKIAKYSAITTSHEFVPIAIETLGPINSSGEIFLKNLGKRLCLTTGEPRESSFLFQRISIALQRYNALSIRGTFGESPCQY